MWRDLPTFDWKYLPVYHKFIYTLFTYNIKWICLFRTKTYGFGWGAQGCWTEVNRISLNWLMTRRRNGSKCSCTAMALLVTNPFSFPIRPLDLINEFCKMLQNVKKRQVLHWPCDTRRIVCIGKKRARQHSDCYFCCYSATSWYYFMFNIPST
jgi:hypothetical protein